MQIGWLRHPVRILTVTTAPGTTGAPVETEAPGALIWADVRTLSGSEQLVPALDVVGASTLYSVTIRYRAGMTPTMRLRWGERVLQVQSVVEADNRQRQLRLICSEEL